MRISIKVRLAIPITLIVIFTAFLLGWNLQRKNEEQYLALMDDYGRSMINSLSYVCREAVIGDDDLFLFALVSKFAAIDEEIEYILITDGSNKIITHNVMEQIGKLFIPVTSSSKETKSADNITTSIIAPLNKPPILNFSSKILFQDVFLGNLHLGLSLETIQAELKRTRRSIVGITCAVAFLGILLSFLIGYLLSKPIAQLVDGTKQISNRNLSHRVPITRNDEIGDLAQSFNKMVENIEKDRLIKEAFGRYIPAEITQSIIKNPSKTWLKGEHRLVSVLFADIRDFTKLTLSEPPEKIVGLLNNFFTLATPIISDHGGFVDKFMGDAIMAVFGIPLHNKLHADKVVETALALQKQVVHFNEHQHTETHPEIKIGIGIASGEVVAGNLGSVHRMEYTVIGEVVNLASRLTKVALGGDIAISETTFKLLNHPHFKYRSETAQLKGIADPVKIYYIYNK